MHFLHGGISQKQDCAFAAKAYLSPVADDSATRDNRAAGRAQPLESKMTFASEIRGFEANLISRIGAGLRSLGEAYEKRRLFNQTVRELEALDSRMLADLGLSRGDIFDAAYKAAYGA